MNEVKKEFLKEMKQKTGMEYNKNTNEIHLKKDENITDQYKKFFKLLIKKEIIDKEDLPYSLDTSYKRNILNDQPFHTNDQEMIRPIEINREIFLETNYSSEGKRKIIKRTLEKVFF